MSVVVYHAARTSVTRGANGIFGRQQGAKNFPEQNDRVQHVGTARVHRLSDREDTRNLIGFMHSGAIIIVVAHRAGADKASQVRRGRYTVTPDGALELSSLV